MALEGASLYIGGEAGTGKSFLLTAIASALAKKGLRVAVTASTGMAALNIGGNTFHSEFGIPLPTPDDIIDGALSNLERDRVCDYEDEDDDDVPQDADDELETDIRDRTDLEGSTFPPRRPLRIQFKNTATLASTDVIVLDEVSMLHAGFLEALERALRQTPGRDSRRPFGGVQLILSGDFMQLTPFAALDLPSGSHRRLPRMGGVGDAMDCKRRVCRCVQRPLSTLPADAKGGSEHLQTTRGNGTHQSADELASRTGSVARFASASKCSTLSETASQNARAGRRKRQFWYYDKPMFESWCFCTHLLHVQLREPLRHKDAAFAADLNELRRGELPFRLSRSAFLNPFDAGAVRLLPTKAAVKNFNDRRMLELNGESHVFRTQLTLAGATATASLTHQRMQHRGGARNANSCCSTLLVHCRCCSLLKRAGNAGVRSKKPFQMALERNQTERVMERHCKFPPHTLQLRSLPVQLSYSMSLSTLILDCRADTQSVAKERRAVVKAALERCMLRQASEAGASSFCSAESRRAPALSSIFPHDILRLEPIEWPQLLRRLQPALQHAFREAVRKDTVLQDKTFKVGCRVMLLRNLSTIYVNGSLGTITRYLPVTECASLMPAGMKASTAQPLSVLSTTLVIKEDQRTLHASTAVLPIVRMDADGREVAIPWITLPVPVMHKGWCYVLRATCVPLMPAYAFTVHKIQGVTLNHPVVFDADGMFPCDHLVYVAASRVRRFEQLRVINLTPSMVSVHVPSLNFTQRIPTVACAMRTWESWRKKPGSTASLFLPSYMDSRKPQVEGVKPDVNVGGRGRHVH
ncbi:putative DNA repair and recombination helicase protein PIF4 [Leptomonas seymouri]|uniref:ATP-dependent DNA helicase n=1 Tax=Leptomonas seymouri TaxID=5684 RepID=A0A0N1IAU3_LEPSE|nr:putative DNA repair and recombination helicase protein PIF4 [Leptomonas seymouri]|eukprot:KPI90802.1 putative DNA repair and recombination helicase protein PIF4 [Leptomonas seymouri]